VHYFSHTTHNFTDFLSKIPRFQKKLKKPMEKFLKGCYNESVTVERPVNFNAHRQKNSGGMKT